jgi:hypothetical protein
MGDVKMQAPQLKALITANTGVDHGIDMQRKRLDADYNKGVINKSVYDERKKKLNAFKKDPEAKLAALQNQLEILSQFTDDSNPLLQSALTKNIPRIEAKIAGLQEVVSKQAEREDEKNFEREMAEFDRNTEILLAKLKGEDVNQKDIDAQNALKLQHILGMAQQLGMQIGIDPELGQIIGGVTQKEANRLKQIAGKLNFSVYSAPTGKERDRPGIFTGSDRLFTVSIVPNVAERGSKEIPLPTETPPIPGARRGYDQQGNPGWYVIGEDGKPYKVNTEGGKVAPKKPTPPQKTEPIPQVTGEPEAFSGVGVLGESVKASVRGITKDIQDWAEKQKSRFEPGGDLFERQKRLQKRYQDKVK